MNDRHPAGGSFPADTGAEYSYAAYDTANHEQSAYGSYGTGAYATATQDDGWSTGAYAVHTGAGAPDAAYYGEDPLYGSLPGGLDLNTGTYPTASPYDGFGGDAYATDAYGTAYESAAYGQDGYGTGAYDTTGRHTGAYDTTGWDTGGWGTGGADHAASGLIPHQPGPHAAEQDWSAPADGTGQWGWDGSAYGHPHAAYADGSAYEAIPYDDSAYDAYDGAYDGNAYNATAFEPTAYGTGSFDAAPWAGGEQYGGVPEGAPGTADGTQGVFGHDATVVGFLEQPTAGFDAYQAPVDTSHAEGSGGLHPDEGALGTYNTDAADAAEGTGDGHADPYEEPYDEPYDEPVISPGSEAEPEPGAAVAGPHRGRRRSPKPRRSALLTVAAPSVAVLGVAGISAASVIPSGDEEPAQAAPDTDEVKVSSANTKLDTQLAGLREAGDDFADRASRTQERIDLKKRQEAERKRKAAEAARREALRPKFALPVEGAGISAYFGQAGINWMSVHSGLDFPVSYGTPVKAATDGTVRTQWNPSYGNMIILTASDGTETWYCHLSSTRIRAGSVKAGTVIGYSGNSGNSTGPHLHFEVRPGGGSAIDPLSWFRSHGLEPT